MKHNTSKHVILTRNIVSTDCSQWVTLDQKSSQATLSMFETGKKREKPIKYENYNSTAPSVESSEAITVASQMHCTRILHSLNTG